MNLHLSQVNSRSQRTQAIERVASSGGGGGGGRNSVKCCFCGLPFFSKVLFAF